MSDEQQQALLEDMIGEITAQVDAVPVDWYAWTVLVAPTSEGVLGSLVWAWDRADVLVVDGVPVTDRAWGAVLAYRDAARRGDALFEAAVIQAVDVTENAVRARVGPIYEASSVKALWLDRADVAVLRDLYRPPVDAVMQSPLFARFEDESVDAGMVQAPAPVQDELVEHLLTVSELISDAASAAGPWSGWSVIARHGEGVDAVQVSAFSYDSAGLAGAVVVSRLARSALVDVRRVIADAGAEVPRVVVLRGVAGVDDRTLPECEFVYGADADRWFGGEDVAVLARPALVR